MANASPGLSLLLLAAAPAALNNGCILIYDGDKPLQASEPPGGALIARITRNGGPWVAGSPANGLQWEDRGGIIAKPLDDAWILKGIATGEARWFRIVGNAPDDGGFSNNLVRLDGTIASVADTGPDAFDLYLSSTAVTPTTERLINDFAFNMF
ncbi:MAG: hypothetical protein ACRC2H_07480 [Silanimonas sp.]